MLECDIACCKANSRVQQAFGVALGCSVGIFLSINAFCCATLDEILKDAPFNCVGKLIRF